MNLQGAEESSSELSVSCVEITLHEIDNPKVEQRSNLPIAVVDHGKSCFCRSEVEHCFGSVSVSFFASNSKTNDTFELLEGFFDGAHFFKSSI